MRYSNGGICSTALPDHYTHRYREEALLPFYWEVWFSESNNSIRLLPTRHHVVFPGKYTPSGTDFEAFITNIIID